MNKFDLESEVFDLINRHVEGEYWDFKEQWYNNNTDLIHDILCMSNSPANRDSYIIIGITDKTCDIIGTNTESRKNQQNVIDLLRQKPKWAGGYIPEVYVITLEISAKEIDVIVIKQSNNTPFYLLEDYKSEGKQIYKGNIYTRKGDTNTPKTSTADLHDIEILWKRHFGLLYNPSQRAKFYLRDLENWERIDGEKDKFGIIRYFFFYKLDPDFTIHLEIDCDIVDSEILNSPNDINDYAVGSLCYYLFAFCNVSYHTDFSNSDKIILYYRDIPLFSSLIECVDESRTKIIPPEYVSNAYYVEDSFRYLIFNFVFAFWCGNYSEEAKEMFLRVIPLYKNDNELTEFSKYIEGKGFSNNRILGKRMSGEALKRLKNTEIGICEAYDNSYTPEQISKKLIDNTNLIINFADRCNKDFEEITKRLQIGKMLVDWLDEWRNKG